MAKISEKMTTGPLIGMENLAFDGRAALYLMDWTSQEWIPKDLDPPKEKTQELGKVALFCTKLCYTTSLSFVLEGKGSYFVVA